MRWRNSALLHVIVLVALGLAIYLFGLGRIYFRGTEPRRALAAREMMQRGNYVVPTLTGQSYLNKPPLMYWAIALVSIPGGEVTPFTARLPSVLAVVGSALLVYGFGRRFLGARAGFLSGLVLLTSGLILEKGALAEIDATFTFLVATASFLSFAAMSASRNANLLWVLSYFCLGIALLAKGPPALIFFCGGLMAFAATEREPKHLLKPVHLFGWMLAAAVVAAWLGPLAAQVGPKRFMSVFYGETVGLASSQSYLALLHPRQLLYYAYRNMFGLLPWSILLPVAFARGWSGSEDATRKRFGRYLIGYIVASLVIFTFFRAKATRYTMPVYPAFALLIGLAWDDCLRGVAPRWQMRYFRLSQVITLATMAAASIGAGAWMIHEASLPAAYAVLFISVGMAICVAGMVAGWRGLLLESFAAVGIVAALFRLAFVAFYVPYFNDLSRAVEISREINAVATADAPIYVLGFRDRQLPLAFYLDRQVTRLEGPGDLQDRARRDQPFYVMLGSDETERLALHANDLFIPIGEWTFDKWHFRLFATRTTAKLKEPQAS